MNRYLYLTNYWKVKVQTKTNSIHNDIMFNGVYML